MSAVCIITTPEEVVIATDGGSFAADGTLAAVGSKVLILPEASAVVTGRGPRDVFVDLAIAVRSSTTRLDLDAILITLPDFIRGKTDELRDGRLDQVAEHDAIEVCIAGWSEDRQAHEAWAVRNHAFEDDEAFVPCLLAECYLDEVPPTTCELFGLRMPSSGDFQWRREPFKYAALNVAALRLCPSRYTAEDPDAWCSVGGFVQVTRISRHAVASEILMEWPDAIGRRIDPNACLEGLDGAQRAERLFGPLGRWENHVED